MSFGQRDLEGELRCPGQEAEKKGHLHVCADNNDPKARAWGSFEINHCEL